LKLNYKTIAEPYKAGVKWQYLFHQSWPSYKAWLNTSGFAQALSLAQREEALLRYMPKMWDTYVHLCSLIDTDDNELAKNFLTGYCPPAYVTACAQAVIKTDKIQLVRNYDYHPSLIEGTLLLSKWNEKKVIATSDCLIGAVDGMNDDGLCVSLTFGGRKQVGIGFGIPFILRYVLEFCSNTKEAVEMLKTIPSHMSYNVTVVDKTGTYKTVLLAPDNEPMVTNAAFATNHQLEVDWPENAKFNQTIKRSNFLKSFLKTKNVNAAELTKAFLHPPLYNNTFQEGFGTLYTAAYQPEKLAVQILWPERAIERNFDYFEDEYLLIAYHQSSEALATAYAQEEELIANQSYNWKDAVVDSLVRALAGRKSKAKQQELREKLMPDGHIAWESIRNYWNESYPK
jgi:predicted choloylglycine hydrolase